MITLSNHSMNEQLNIMRSEKGKTCISIIIPLYDLSPQRKSDKLHLDHAIRGVRDELLSHHPGEAGLLINTLEELSHEISLDRTQEGLGLYVSENVKHHFGFPFPVKEKITLAKSFELIDIVYMLQYARPYGVLLLDEKRARLYRGKLKSLEEIENGEFPLSYELNYEFEKPSPGSSYAGYAQLKGFDKDRSVGDKKRFETFFQHTDELLGDYIRDFELVILCGIKTHTAAFMNRTTHANKIISIINGNYDRFQTHELATIIWPSIQAFVAEKMLDAISTFQEENGEGKTEEGMVRVWQAALEGRGLTLLVEKDYKITGFIERKYNDQFYLKPTRQTNTVLTNAVGEVIDMVLSHDGEIVVTENGMLTDHQNIALITRY